jgi:hypothetical protein
MKPIRIRAQMDYSRRILAAANLGRPQEAQKAQEPLVPSEPFAAKGLAPWFDWGSAVDAALKIEVDPRGNGNVYIFSAFAPP